MPNLLFIIILSYLVGSIPISIILTKIIKGVDIRNFGSGNAGGTNVSRVLGKKYGILVILLDAIKGVIAVIFISRLYLGSFPFSNTTPFDDFTLILSRLATSSLYIGPPVLTLPFSGIIRVGVALAFTKKP